LSAGNATTAGFVTINEEGFDTDFRVEASGVANALFVQGSDGAVGIGTDSPAGKLHVKVAAASVTPIATADVGVFEFTAGAGTDGISLLFPDNRSGQIVFGTPNDNDAGRIVYYGPTVTTVANRDTLAFFSNDAEVMRLDGSANVGIGAAPGTLLELFGTAPYLTLRNSTHEQTDGGRESKIIFEGEQADGSDSTLAVIQASHDGTSDDEKGDLIFSTNDGDDAAAPTERLRIDSAGDVGIGTDGPITKFHVVESALTSAGTSTGDIATFENDGNSNLNLIGSTANTSAILFSDTTRARGLIRYNHGAVYTGTDTMEFAVNGASTKLTIRADGDIRVDSGNLIIGTAGKGIDFSAQTATATGTTTAELLDHYECGTWTAGFTAASGTITIHTSYNLMRYTRIGRLVHVQGNAVISSVSTPSGLLTLTGLPFTVNNNTDGEASSASVLSIAPYDMVATVAGFSSLITQNTTTVQIFEFDGTTHADMANHIKAGTQLGISGTYTV
jgi:hypothetical protein